MRRGEIWVANLNPARGRETGKVRPVLILQADELGPELTPLVVVLPLSSQPDNHPLQGRLHLPLPARDRLLKPSLVLVDQPRTLDRSRLGDGPLAVLRADEMRAVERILRRVAGL